MNTDTVNDYAGFVEAFIQNHPFVTAMILALLCSWLVTALFKMVIVRPFIPAKFHLPTLLLFDCLIAGWIIVKMWPGTHAPIWALFVGSSSPTVYAIASALLCWWKPGLRRFLQLREFTPAPDPTDQAAATADPPPNHTDTQ